ncbi:ATP-dependent protease ClpP, protease subunit [Pseudomonas sp. ok272]|uniref:head maturation protease, ClpP-related n=1 Tax=unclassified Pseudomonas TaxID=196821 RepID=UPI0008CBBA60|nr:MULTISPECIES: head maturation protease, ClpP-related [unclassified Pseudomonas]SEN18990.1 ATP-dependent protease ClpP, protease subunit [Pseudomonas sp. ok272]SFN11023.1 ATP-dependent protease ClpP, protease subunit [Pseudomonas sp. ok602]
MTPFPTQRIFNTLAGQLPIQDKHWYSLKASGEAEQRTIEVYVYGEIGTWGITANQFVRDLAALDDGVSPIVVAFNSIGGELFDGLAIHNALARLGERCTGRIDALAASAASVAVCGAKRVVIASNALMMIHNPWTYASGDAEELRKVAVALDQALEVIISAYKAKAPDIDEVELRRLVNAETWLTASEAVALGLADEVGEGVQIKACLGQGSLMQKYQHTPKTLLDQLAEPEPPAMLPEPEPDPVVDQTALALLITQSCTQAGISNLIEPLIAATRLADQATVQAALTQAKATRDLCIAARLPQLTEGFVKAGLDTAAVRAKLFDKLVSGTGGFEIDNSLPQADDPAPLAQTQAKQPDPNGIYAARKAAQSQPSKGARP